MATGRRATERAALAILLALGRVCARAQGTLTAPSTPAASPAPVSGGGMVLSEGSMNDVHKLLEVATPIAREWSPGAKLYSMYGRAPRNEERWSSEEWGFIFGDPKTKDGSFHIIFQDGVVRTRQGIKGGVKMVDQFKNGQFQGRETDFARNTNDQDYGNCKPADPDFVGTKVLEKLIVKYKLRSDSSNMYNFSLFRPLNDQCDGLGRYSLFLSDKPIPSNLMKKTLWIVHTPNEIVFVDAKTGKILHRRKRK